MYAKIFAILSIAIKIIDCLYLTEESNFLKPKLERTNVVNKRVWVRNKLSGDIYDNFAGNFIFQPNSLGDDGVQNTFDSFGGNNINALGSVSFQQRKRRSPDHLRKRRPRKSMKQGKIIKSNVEDAVMIKSKLVSDLRPSSVFNEYPYEVSILLNNESDKNIGKHKHIKKESHKKHLKSKHPNIPNDTDDYYPDLKEEINIVSLNINNTNTNDTSRRKKKFDRVVEGINNLNVVEDTNKTETLTEMNKQERDMFSEKEGMWKQNSLLTANNFYKVVPKEYEKSSSVTERGLIKVISMLTKTFKKIMNQHNEIKIIHASLLNINQNFEQKLTEVTTKFDDFDSKYADMIQFNNKLKAFDLELHSQRDYFDIKQKEIHDTIMDFQEQQRKFLVQQRQFYAIQKLMISQNEKINAKQNVIAQTQGQISHRQNNFARILKKAKQLLTYGNKTRLNNIKPKPENLVVVTTPQTTVEPLTSTLLPNTESMKINLFSIPSKTNKPENQDALIIKEKDEKQIDDLVYKYYFNNTFIDALMKSKILNNYATNSESVEIVNRSKLSKNKRNELETTLMVPVNNSLSDAPLKRERRWINHFSKNKYKRINTHKNSLNMFGPKNSEISKAPSLNDIKSGQTKNDPFLAMATTFCNEIGQNTNEQILKWCVEKALRRLKFMEMNSFTPPPQETLATQVHQEALGTTNHYKSTVNYHEKRSNPNTGSIGPMVTTVMVEQPHTTLQPVFKNTPVYLVTTADQIYFPDNDELESNLKQFDLKPDTEGNVYYDGSLHISDYGKRIQDSGGNSDIMPGLMDSDSRMDIDPMTFVIQAERRANVRRMNEYILHQNNNAG